MRTAIFIENLEVQTIIGICDWEQDTEQPLYFDIEMQVDSASVAKSDAIEDALDYAAVAEKVERLVKASKVKLLEPLLAEVAQQLFLSFNKIDELALTVRKPRAIENASCAGVSWCCSRADVIANQNNL